MSIAATTPRNPRRHIVAVPAAYIKTTGPVCPACWDARRDERALVGDIVTTYMPLLEPVRLPSGTPPELLRVYTRIGKVVRTEPLTAADDYQDRTNGRRNGGHR